MIYYMYMYVWSAILVVNQIALKQGRELYSCSNDGSVRLLWLTYLSHTHSLFTHPSWTHPLQAPVLVPFRWLWFIQSILVSWYVCMHVYTSRSFHVRDLETGFSLHRSASLSLSLFTDNKVCLSKSLWKHCFDHHHHVLIERYAYIMIFVFIFV